MSEVKADPANSEAVQEAVSGVLVHTLRKPLEYEGKTHEAIHMDLRALTGKDLAELQAQWTHAGNFSMQPETDSDFCLLVAARAAKVVEDVLYALPAPECTAIETMVKVFLQGANIAKQMGEAPQHGLTLKLEELTGRDTSQIKREWVANGGRASFPATDLNYCALVAARAAGVKLEAIHALPAPVYVSLMREVSDFLQS